MIIYIYLTRVLHDALNRAGSAGLGECDAQKLRVPVAQRIFNKPGINNVEKIPRNIECNV